jgi:acyl carrier protein
MTREEAREVVLAALHRIAPEIDLDALDPDADFQADADLDSVDVLNLLVAVQDETGVEVPDRIAGSLTSIAALSTYVAEHA